MLYCPKTGISNKQKRWEKIEAALKSKGVEYDMVQSETSDSVERLMTMLINNGYKNIDQTIDWLTKHRVRKVDLGCIRYTNKEGERCHRYFLNCLNIGLTADIMNLRRQTRRLFGSRTLSFVSSLFVMLFHRMEYKMKLRINTDVVDRKVMTVCVGSGPGYGQTPNAVPYNGMLDVSVVYHPEVVQLIEGLWLLISGRFLNHRNVHPFRTTEVTVEEAKKALIGIDGRLMKTPVGPFRICIEQEVINFLIPD